LLAQADVGWVGQGATIDSFIFRDGVDGATFGPFDLLRDSRVGRRFYYLVGNGAVKTMTVKVQSGAIVDIINEN
jgi:hypothetical protein